MRGFIIRGDNMVDIDAFNNISNESIRHQIIKSPIYIPRLRGCKDMTTEVPIGMPDMHFIQRKVCEDMIEGIPEFSVYKIAYRCNRHTRKLLSKYLNKDMSINWSNLHGKTRKVVKFALKRKIKSVKSHVATFNKYVGKDVLCMYARLGGFNWNLYGNDIQNEPWFIEKVDDYTDSTYCYIYVRKC